MTLHQTIKETKEADSQRMRRVNISTISDCLLLDYWKQQKKSLKHKIWEALCLTSNAEKLTDS